MHRATNTVRLAAIAAAGCQSPDNPPATGALGDTIVVWSDAPRIEQDVDLELVTRYGSLQGDEASTINAVAVHAVGPDGSVYVLDLGTGLKRFNPDGSFGEWIARYGQGPPDVRLGRGLAVHSSGTVAFWDLGNDRISYFGDGRPSSVRTGARRPRYTDGALTWVGDTLWAQAAPALDPTEAFKGPILFRLDGTPQFVDSLAAPDRYFEYCPTLSDGRFREGFWEDKRDPWLPKVRISIGEKGRLAFGCPAEFEFDVVSRDGQVRRVTWAREKVPIEEFEISDVSGPLFGPGEEPDEKPAYSRIILEPSGRIWVWPNQPGVLEPVKDEFIPIAGKSEVYRIPRREGVFDVFEEDGSWLATVRMPPGMMYSGHATEAPAVVRGDSLWAVYRDEFDVEYVGKFVVRWPN